MSTAGYKRECEEAAADAATKLEITAQAKLRAVEPEVLAACCVPHRRRMGSA